MNPSGESSSPDASRSAIQLIDLERAKIGHDLHDLLLPLIFAASANLQPIVDAADASDDPAVEKIRQSQQWLQEALLLGRNLLTQIYPPELEKLPWLVATKESARRICENACEVIWTVDPDSPVCNSDWDRDTAAAAYRIVVEALLNAIKHGQAETVAIRCHADSIVIVDDGNGFDPAAVESNRFGIRSMKGRAKLVGQAVEVTSEPGGPTKVTLSV